MTFKEKALLKILVIIAEILGKDVEGFYGWKLEQAIKEDKTGLGFCYSMFAYELANHEYGYTYELEDTLDALDLTLERINKEPNLKAGLDKALAEYKED